MNYEQMRERMATCIQRISDNVADSAGAQSEFLNDYAEDLCKSEIEKVFFVAWMLELWWAQRAGSSHGGDAAHYLHPPDSDGGNLEVPHFVDPVRQFDVVCAQYRVGNYVADFALRRAIRPDGDRGLLDLSPKVLVECDGHEFHERTKEQAAHDKERDRLLQTQGYYVLRFTGSELWKNPARCVEQVDEFLEEHIARTHRERRRKQ